MSWTPVLQYFAILAATAAVGAGAVVGNQWWRTWRQRRTCPHPLTIPDISNGTPRLRCLVCGGHE
jgi:hypothetical protein